MKLTFKLFRGKENDFATIEAKDIERILEILEEEFPGVKYKIVK